MRHKPYSNEGYLKHLVPDFMQFVSRILKLSEFKSMMLY